MTVRPAKGLSASAAFRTRRGRLFMRDGNAGVVPRSPRRGVAKRFGMSVGGTPTSSPTRRRLERHIEHFLNTV